MANRLQWNNVTAPNFSGINDLYLRSSGLIKDALGGFGEKLGKLQIELDKENLDRNQSNALIEFNSLKSAKDKQDWIIGKEYLKHFGNTPVSPEFLNTLGRGVNSTLSYESGSQNLKESKYSFARQKDKDYIEDRARNFIANEIYNKNISDPVIQRGIIQNSNLPNNIKAKSIDLLKLGSTLGEDIISGYTPDPEKTNIGSLYTSRDMVDRAEGARQRISNVGGLNLPVLQDTIKKYSPMSDGEAIGTFAKETGISNFKYIIPEASKKLGIPIKELIILLNSSGKDNLFSIQENSWLNTTPFKADTDFSLDKERTFSIFDDKLKKARDYYRYYTSEKGGLQQLALASQTNAVVNRAKTLDEEAKTLREDIKKFKSTYGNISDNNTQKRNEYLKLMKRVEQFYNNQIGLNSSIENLYFSVKDLAPKNNSRADELLKQARGTD